MQPFGVTRCCRQRLYKTTGVCGKLVRSFPAATVANYQELSDFERGVTAGAQDVGHSISEVTMKLHRDYRLSNRYQQNIKSPTSLLPEKVRERTGSSANDENPLKR